MKKRFLVLVTTLGSALGAFAQGQVDVDNYAATTSRQGVSDFTADNYYAGPYGVQVWELSPPPTGAALATLLNTINNSQNTVGYAALVANGFKLEKEVDNQTSPGYYVSSGLVNLPDVTPAGGNIILGLAIWNTPTSYATAVAAAGTRLGVIAFPQTTLNPVLQNGTPPNITLGWLSLNGGTGQELVMTPIPEPGSLAILGLGAGVLLAFRRRGRCRPPPPARSP